MKKLKKLFTFVLLALICLMSSTITSCADRKSIYDDSMDSLKIKRTCTAIIDGTSTDADEFTKITIAECKRDQFINIVKNLHYDVITTIAECVIKKDGLITYDTFVKEYFSNQNIYDTQNEIIQDVNRSYDYSSLRIIDTKDIPEIKDTTGYKTNN